MISDPLVQVFERLAAREPERVLVRCKVREVSAEQILDAAVALARRIADRSGEPGDLVALQAPNGPGFLSALIALRRLGRRVVLLDAGTPADETSRVCREFGARSLLLCRNAWPVSTDCFVASPINVADTGRPIPEGTEFVKVTSGSTGDPRGIAVSSEALLADDEQLRRTMGIRDDDRLLAVVPFAHSYGLSSLVLPALTRGIALLVPAEAGPFAAVQNARAFGATVFPTVPAFIDAVARASSTMRWPESLRLTISAGAPLTGGAARRFREAFERPVHVFYGASECGGISYDRDGGAAERGSVGEPIDGVRVSLQDAAAGRGRIVVESPAVACGYLSGPDTRLGGGRFVSEDVGRWNGTELELCGRADRQINIKGKKVDPAEIERVLRDHPGVKEAAVVAATGANGATLIRAFLATEADDVTRESIQSWCRDRLSDHKRPKSFRIVADLPRTGRGKVDRRLLLSPAEGPDRA